MPNFKLLNNAIKQTQGKDLSVTKDNIKEFLVQKLSNVDFDDVRKDVERFLEDKSELKLLDKEIMLKTVRQHLA